MKKKYDFYILPGDDWFPEGIPDPLAPDEEEEFERVLNELPGEPFGSWKWKIIRKIFRLASWNTYFSASSLKIYDAFNTLKLYRKKQVPFLMLMFEEEIL